jgi:hypothetical protein
MRDGSRRADIPLAEAERTTAHLAGRLASGGIGRGFVSVSEADLGPGCVRPGLGFLVELRSLTVVPFSAETFR